MFHKINKILALLLSLAPLTVRAQNVVYPPKTVFRFGDDTIQGDIARPDMAYLESRRRARHTKLTQLRVSFRQEMLHCLDQAP